MYCPDWQDPRNVGAAFRLADAAGLAGIVLAGSTPRPPNRRIARTARTTVRSVPCELIEDPVEDLNSRRSAGALLLALELTTESHDLLGFTLPAPVVTGGQEVILIPGGEAEGVPQRILDLCHASVHLPLHGQNSSMNVAVATGAAVYLLLAQFR